jgi:tetratricopeptide (TPR) repeat protein
MPITTKQSTVNHADADLLLRLGDYAGSAKSLGALWPGVGLMPSRNGHGDEFYARLLMTCGFLTIKLGNIGQVKVQAIAKDMLTESARLFGGHPDRQTAWLRLGAVYLLCGEYNEAATLAETLLNTDTDVEVVFAATLVRAIAEIGLKQAGKSLDSLASVEMLVPVVPTIDQGKFYLNRGVAWRNLSEPNKAIEDYNRALELFEDVKALRWEAATANNLAGVYTDLGQFQRAHTFVERAISLFRQLGDKAHEAKSWDQSARIYLKEEKFNWAERNASTAVAMLVGDNQTWRAEALVTHGIALSRIGYQRATDDLLEAVRICEHVGSLQQADEARLELWRTTRTARKLSESVTEALRPLESSIIERVLAKYDGAITHAASDLGLNRNALQKKITQLGLTRKPKRKRHRSIRARH